MCLHVTLASLHDFTPARSCNGHNFALQSCSGGDEENRTPDPLLARQVLSQLSYTPVFCFDFAFMLRALRGVSLRIAFGNRSLLATDCKLRLRKLLLLAFLRDTVTTLLRKVVLVEMRRIELLTPCLQGRCSPS